MSFTFIIFIIAGTLAIASGLVTIRSRNPVVSAVSLVFHFFMLAALYLTLNAQFVAVMQVLVYAGAIMVLVVFVIMLLNLGDEHKLKERFSFQKVIAVLFGIVFLFQILAIYLTFSSGKNEISEKSVLIGTAQEIGKELYSNYLIPFEAIALLLLAAIIGAVILAKKKIE